MKYATCVLILYAVHIAAAAESSNASQTFCRAKWTTGTTLNQRMYDHCVEELNESTLQVENFERAHARETWFKDMVRQGCTDRWTKDGFAQPEMISYCYKQELASYNELKYQSTLASYNSGCAEACFKVWQSKPGTVFGKTEECYRKRSEAPNFALPRSLLLLLDSGPATETAGQSHKENSAN